MKPFLKIFFCVIFVFFSEIIFAQTIINFEENGDKMEFEHIKFKIIL